MNKSACLLTWIILMLVSAGGLRAQVLRAGQHTPEQYFMDVDPDTTFTGPNNHYPNMLPAAAFPVDIEGDGISDLVFLSYGFWLNGMGYTYIRIQIPDTNLCRVAAGNPDTCSPSGSYNVIYPMALSFRADDVIGPDAAWKDSLFLTYSDWLLKGYNCSVNRFADDPQGNYVGVQRIRAADTLYGWIKVSGVSTLTMTVEEFACTRNISSLPEAGKAIRFFPSPVVTILFAEPTAPGDHLTVFNALGSPVLQTTTGQGRTVINLEDQPSGIYLVRLTQRNRIIRHKVIKQ